MVQALIQRDQWVLWREVIRDGGKSTKMPCGKNGRATSISNKECLKPFAKAYDEWNNDKTGNIDGIGFSIMEDDEITFIDLDSINQWYGWREIVRKFKNTYIEWSPSHNGLHIFTEGYLPCEENCRRVGSHDEGGIEIYDGKRYATVTFDPLEGCGENDVTCNQTEIQWLYDSLDDKKLLAKVMSSNVVDKMQLLWEGKWKEAGYDSHSEADLGFCRVLSNNHAPIHQIDRIFRKTKLYRDKWMEKRGKETYGQMTLRTATTERTKQ